MALLFAALVIGCACAVAGPPKGWMTFIQPGVDHGSFATQLCNVSLATGNITRCVDVLGVNDSFTFASWVDGGCTAYAPTASVILVIQVCNLPHPVVVDFIRNVRTGEEEPVNGPVTWDLRRGLFYTEASNPVEVVVARNVTTGRVVRYLNVTKPANVVMCEVTSRLAPDGNALFVYLRCEHQDQTMTVRVCTLDLANHDAAVCQTANKAGRVLALAQTVIVDSSVRMPLVVSQDTNVTIAAQVNFTTLQWTRMMNLPDVDHPSSVIRDAFTPYAVQGWAVVCYLVFISASDMESRCTAFNAATHQAVNSPSLRLPRGEDSTWPRSVYPVW